MAYNKIQKIVLNSIRYISIILSALVLFTGCTLNPIADSEAGNPTVVSASALINLPTSLALDSLSIWRNSRQQDVKDNADNIYDIIRVQNYFVNELVNGDSMSIRSFLEEEIAQLPWNYIIKTGSYIFDTLTYHFEATYTAAAAFPYQVYAFYNDPVNGWIIKTAFNGSVEYPKGWFYLFIDSTGDFRTDSLAILVSFEKTASHRLLDIEIDQKLLIQSEDLAQSFTYSWYEANGIIHLSGMSYYPYLDSILKDTVGYCYTYTAVADTSVTDTNENIAIVNLGLPPASYSDTALHFTTYGIANAYGNYFVNYSIPALDDTSKMLLATSIKDTLTLLQIFVKMQDTTFKLHDPSEADSLSIDDLILYLELNKGILALITDETVKKEYAALLWILKLRQPVYFNAKGYVGNGETVPLGFEALAAIPCNRPRFIPLEVKELIITMP